MAKSKRKKRSNLFRRYFLSSSVTIFLGFICLGFFMMVFISGRWWDEKFETLTSNVRNISSAYVNLYSAEEERGTNEALLCNTLKIMSESTLSNYYVVNLEGEIIYCGNCALNDEERAVDHTDLTITDEHMASALDGGFSDYIADAEFGIGKLIVATPIKYEGENIAVVFAVEDAVTDLGPYIVGILQSFSYALLIALIIVFIALFKLTKGITEPLSEMKEITKHFAKGDFEYKANENYKKRDFSEFAKALNKMGNELKVTEESRKSFVANVSHELKTPMTSIGGFIDGILDGTIPPEQEKKYLSVVSNEVKRLSRMVVAMLNLSKIEAGEICLSPTKYDVVKQVFETLLSFEKKIDEKHIEIVGFESMENVEICADRDLLQQVIYNLIDNAVKFTPENGTITINARNNGGKTFVSIRNSGAGVSEEEISRIFERFYKVDKSRSFDVKGVGLGLYIVKTVINMHDGEISATSKQGEYTEFSFEIPFNP